MIQSKVKVLFSFIYLSYELSTPWAHQYPPPPHAQPTHPTRNITLVETPLDIVKAMTVTIFPFIFRFRANLYLADISE